MYNGEVGNSVIIVPDGRSSNSKRTCPYRPDLVAARASGAPMTSRPVVSTAANQSINQSINCSIYRTAMAARCKTCDVMYVIDKCALRHVITPQRSYQRTQSINQPRPAVSESGGSGTDLILLFLFLLQRRSSKNSPQAPSFQIGSG